MSWWQCVTNLLTLCLGRKREEEEGRVGSPTITFWDSPQRPPGLLLGPISWRLYCLSTLPQGQGPDPKPWAFGKHLGCTFSPSVVIEMSSEDFWGLWYPRKVLWTRWTWSGCHMVSSIWKQRCRRPLRNEGGATGSAWAGIRETTLYMCSVQRGRETDVFRRKTERIVLTVGDKGPWRSS